MESDFQGLLWDAWTEEGRWGVVKCLLRESVDVLRNGLETRWRDMMTGWGLDLKCGMRALARRKEFSLVAILTLALAIGSSTAMFSVLDGVLLRSLPYGEPDRLVRLITTYEGGNRQPSVSVPDAVDVRAAARTLSDLVIYRPWSPTLTGLGPADPLDGLMFSHGFLDVLGIEPALGRGFVAEEDIDGRDRVVIISYGFWQSRFGGDPDALGRSVTLSGVAHVIVGVGPQKFGQVLPGFPSADVWRPLGFGGIADDDLPYRGNESYWGMARLASPATLTEARAELAQIMGGIADAHPDTNTGQSMTVDPFHTQAVGNVRGALLIFAGAVGFVLLAGIANVVGLFLGRAVEREQEVALRAALGAGRARIYRQLLVESLMVAACGVLLGTLLAIVALPTVIALGSGSIPLVTEIRIDARVLAVAALCGLVAALVSGLVPGVRALHPDLFAALRGGADRGSTAGVGRIRLRRTVVVSQVAVSVLMLVGAALLARSFSRLSGVDAGLETNLLTFRLSPPAAAYETDEQVAQFYRSVRERLVSVPGVEGVAFTTGLPMTARQTCGSLYGTDDPGRFEGQDICAEARAISTEYLELVGLPILEGRGFEAFDGPESADVVIINETTAGLLWPGEDPVGRELATGLGGRTHRVVGVVSDVKQFRLSEPAPPQTYLPLQQWPRVGRNVVVRAGSQPMDFFPAMRAEVAGVDADVPLTEVGTLGDFVRASLVAPRFRTTLLVTFAAMTLLMSLVGIYGLVAYSVSQRRREMAIRLSLGAKRSRVLSLVVAHEIRDVILGVTLGVLAAVVLAGVLDSLLFEVSAADPISFFVTPALTLAIAALASLVPAVRATRLDPAEVLRAE